MSASTSNQKPVHTAAGRFASTQWSFAPAAGFRLSLDHPARRAEIQIARRSE
jgi:hypothetical protein